MLEKLLTATHNLQEMIRLNPPDSFTHHACMLALSLQQTALGWLLNHLWLWGVGLTLAVWPLGPG